MSKRPQSVHARCRAERKVLERAILRTLRTADVYYKVDAGFGPNIGAHTAGLIAGLERARRDVRR